MAHAEPAQPARLAVIPVAAPGESRAALARACATLASPRLELLGDGVELARAARATGAVPAQRLAELAAVTAAGAEGWRAYLQVAVPYAASRLAKARSDAEALLPLPGGLEVYADLSLRLGAVLLTLERRAEAEDALALALALDPERELGLTEFSPDVIEAAARAAARTAAPVRLTVTTPGVAGARVELDGQSVGQSVGRPTTPTTSGAPSTVLLVSPGQHVVVARHPGHEPVAQAIRITEATAIELTLAPDRFARALLPATPGLGEDAALALVEAVATYAEADQVLLLASAARRGALAVLAQRCDARARCTAVVEVGYADRGLEPAVRAAWTILERGELRYPPSLPGDSRLTPTTAGGGDGRCKLCRSPWLWAGVGAALAASAALLVVLAQDDPTPIVVVDPGTFQ